MRVADSMITDLARSSVAAAKDRAVAAQRVASTGLRVGKPSDDPAAAATGRRKTSEEARVASMLKTTNTSALTLDAIDDGLAHVDTLLARAQELAVQAANGTLSTTDRAALAGEMSSIRDAVLGVANMQMDGKFVLGGMRQDTPPFDATGAFVGDRNVPTLEVAQGVRVPTAVAAGNVLAPTGGLDVPAALARLVTAFNSSDLPTIRAGIDDLTTATVQVSSARGAIGASQSSMQMAISLGEQLKNRVIEARSNAVEADTYDAITQLTTTQTALQQAVAIASRLPLPGLAQK